jgi:hypothetical protein
VAYLIPALVKNRVEDTSWKRSQPAIRAYWQTSIGSSEVLYIITGTIEVVYT